jgi:2-furoyl-CoA dehydrogenase large subunit
MMSPLECYVVIAEYLPGEAAYEVTANFQGPFAMHPVMAMAPAPVTLSISR